jgi:hypothetical protein
MTLILTKIRLDHQGYDSKGTYWGTGKPLWHAGDEEGDFSLHFRAYDREEAKEYVLKRYPNAEF